MGDARSSGEPDVDAYERAECRAAHAMAYSAGWRLDRRTGAIDWSPDALSMLGGDSDRPGHDLERHLDTVIAEDRPILRAAVDRLRAPGDVLDQTVRLVLDGGERTVQYRAELIVDADGSAAVVGAVRDVTDIEERERALAQMGERTRIANEFARVGWWQVDVGADRALWDETTAAIHGMPAGYSPSVGDAIGFYAAESQHRIAAAFEECMATGRPYDEVLRLRRGDGREIWVRAIGRARSEGGAIVGAYGAFQDVTELMEARTAADEFRVRLAHTLDLISDGFVVVKPDCTVTYVNRQLRQLFGLGSGRIDGAVLWDLLPGTQGTEFEEQCRGAAQSGRSALFTVDIESLGCTMEVRADPVPDGIALYLRDVTERRRMDEWVSRVQRLESVGRLTAGVAHDFNNLLTVITGNIELLAEVMDDTALVEAFVEPMRAAVGRGANLTRSLAAYARQQPLEPEITDLNTCVDNVLRLLRSGLREDVSVEVRTDPDLWPVDVDTSQFEVALMNLAVNARDAMAGGGRLVVETAMCRVDDDDRDMFESLPAGEYVVVAVSDEGSGMSDEVRRRAFEPFFTDKAHGVGTGLGLSMVHGFTHQSGGDVRIYSELGQGTTVRMYFPRARVDDTTPGDDLSEPPSVPAGGDEHVLVVEDDDLVRAHVERVLGSYGYRVSTAGDGHDALAMLESDDRVDLLFTDVVMPGGLNGRELADEATARHPHLRVLFTSGYTANAIDRQGRLDADAELLSKPYRHEDLARRVRGLLD
ncbi:MAG: PAS domain-containing protein [Acidimicrobiales bacterium]